MGMEYLGECYDADPVGPRGSAVGSHILPSKFHVGGIDNLFH